jgi:hypothetical protein
MPSDVNYPKTFLAPINIWCYLLSPIKPEH